MRGICHGVESSVTASFSHSKNTRSRLVISIYGNTPQVCAVLDDAWGKPLFSCPSLVPTRLPKTSK